MTGRVGVIVNPSAGRDIRRLVAAASSTSDLARVGIIRRAVIGALEGGAEEVLIGIDHKGLGRHAIRELDEAQQRRVRIFGGDDAVATGLHTRRVAAQMRDAEVGAVIVLGGDGTQRDVALGWRDVALMPISTGTNNVFPRMVEATVAGHAAAVVANRPGLGLPRAKVLDVTGPGDRADLALVDLALVDGRFTASRAVWDPALLRELVVTIAEPATIGLSSIAARIDSISRNAGRGLHLSFGPVGVGVRAPIGPGLYADLTVSSSRALEVGDQVTLAGPGVLAFDGERDLVLDPDDSVVVTLQHDGPAVIDPNTVLASSDFSASWVAR